MSATVEFDAGKLRVRDLRADILGRPAQRDVDRRFHGRAANLLRHRKHYARVDGATGDSDARQLGGRSS